MHTNEKHTTHNPYNALNTTDGVAIPILPHINVLCCAGAAQTKPESAHVYSQSESCSAETPSAQEQHKHINSAAMQPNPHYLHLSYNNSEQQVVQPIRTDLLNAELPPTGAEPPPAGTTGSSLLSWIT